MIFNAIRDELKRVYKKDDIMVYNFMQLTRKGSGKLNKNNKNETGKDSDDDEASITKPQ